jgi:hypothetical protein
VGGVVGGCGCLRAGRVRGYLDTPPAQHFGSVQAVAHINTHTHTHTRARAHAAGCWAGTNILLERVSRMASWLGG